MKDDWCRMPTLTLLACCAVVFVMALQARWTRRFVKDFDLTWPKIDADKQAPVAVILPLRGADPSLPGCLRGLLNQRYGSFALHVVLDRADDPAAKVVNEVFQAHPQFPVHIHVLKNPRRTCGLKVSALTQVIEELSDSTAYFALIDADAQPDPDWLSELVAPFSDPTVGATSGIRWYCPQGDSLPDTVRRQWNGDAVVQMHSFQVPWGGSLAIRSDVASDSRTLERWRNCICEDAPLAATLKELGMRLQIVPNVILVNDESIDMAGCFQFIRRQILFTLLHHPARKTLAAFWLLKTMWTVGLIVATVSNAMSGEILWATVSGLAFLSGYATQVLLLKQSARAVRTAMTRRLGIVQKSRFDFHTMSAGLFTINFTAAAFLSALMLRRVSWRGITYKVRKNSKIRMVRYLPYQPRDYANVVSQRSIA